MIKLTLITVGNLPKGPFSELGAEYRKRLGPYVKLDHRVVADESKIAKQIPAGDYVIILDELGKSVSTKFAAQMMKKFEDQGLHVTVIIGGPKGLSLETKKHAKLLFALSRLTLTHDFAHLLLLEQLYRMFTIMRGKKYHY